MSDTLPIQPRSPTFDEVLANAVRSGLGEVHTNMPGRIVSYDADKQLCDVQPLVQQQVLQEDGTTASVSYPVLKNVPVIFPGANGFRITLPIVKDDEVSLCFTECSLEVWKANGGIVNPKDARRFHISDATATPGLHSNKAPWKKASKDAMTMGADSGPQVVFRTGSIELGSDSDNPPSDMVALASLVKTELSHLHDKLDSLVTAFNSNNSSLQLHTHPLIVAPGGGSGTSSPSLQLATLEPGQSPDPVGDVKSAKVKSL